jgi:hypothetical protein
MAEYSYAGLSVVVKAVTDPMTASIKAAALKAGNDAAATLQKTISAGIRTGMRAGWTDAQARSAAKAAGKAAATAFGDALLAGMKAAGVKAAAGFEETVTAGTRAGAKRAAKAGAQSFEETFTPGAAAAGKAAGTALATTFSGTVVSAASAAGVAAARAFEGGFGSRMKAIGAAEAWTWRAEFIPNMTKYGGQAAIAAAEQFDAVMGPRMKAIGAAEAWTWRAEVIPNMTKAGTAVASSTALAIESGLTPKMSRIGTLASKAMNSNLVTNMRIAGGNAAASFTYAMESSIKPAMSKVSASVKTGMGTIASSAGGAVKAVGLVAGALGGGFLAYAIKAGVEYNVLYQKSIKAFQTILGSQAAANQMMANLTAFAKTSPFPRQTFIAATQQMLGFGVAAKDIIPTLSAVQDAVAAVGGNASDISGVVAVLAKVDSQGKFTARTLNEMGTRGIDAAALIGKGMNLTSAQVRKAITKDTLNTQAAMTALVTQMQIKYAGAANGLKSTWVGAKQSIQAAMRDIGSAIVAPFISPTGGGLAIQWANKLGKVLWAIEPAVKPLADALMQSLAPAINAVNKAINWLLDQTDKLAGANLTKATDAVKKFGAAGLAASIGLSALTAGKLVSGIPILGDVVTGLVGPFKAVATAMLDLTDPFAWILDAIILIVASSAKLRDALTAFGRAAISAAMPAVHQLVAGFKEVWPSIRQVAGIIGDGLAPVVDHLTKLLKPLGTILAVVIDVLFKVFLLDLKLMMPVLRIAFRVIGDVLDGLLDPLIGLATGLAWVYTKIGWFADNTVKALKTTARVLEGIWRPFQAETVRVWDAVASAFAAAWRVISGVVSTAWGVITTIFRVAFAVIESIVLIWLVLVRAVFLVEFIIWRKIFTTFWGWVGPYVMGALRILVAVVKVILAPFVLLFKVAWDAIKLYAQAVIWFYTSALPAAWHWVASVTAKAWHAIFGPIKTAWDDVKTWTGDALSWVSSTVSKVWGFIASTTATMWDQITAPLKAFWSVIKKPITDALNWLGGLFASAWAGLVKAAESVGGDVLRVLKAGFEAAWAHIGDWIKAEIVDPIVNGVKKFFGIGGTSGASSSSSGKSGPAPAGFAAGPQGGGGTGGGGASPGAGLLASAWGDVGGMMQGLVHDVVDTSPLDVAKTVFGSVEKALAYIVVKGIVAVENLGKAGLNALESIPGVTSVMHFLSGLWSGAVNVGKSLLGIGSGRGVGGLAAEAMAFNGHQYVWGGGANSRTGFDCSSFVNMLAGSEGLPIPGGFRAPSDQHGPVTGNWLTFGALKTIPYNSMLPGDIYVNNEHMGIVTGLGTGFAARSTDTGTGPQTVPRGLYTIRRFPGGGGTGGVSNASLLAQALGGLLSQKLGEQPVIATSNTANLLTVARYMATNGWSLPGAAGVAGNVFRESGGDPLAYGTGGRGLIGWTPPSTLPNAAFVVGNPSLSLTNQLPLVDTFFVNSMGGKYWRLANAQTDPAKAALIIMNEGERPAGSSAANPLFGGSGTSGASQREAMARSIFDELRKSATVKMASGGTIREPVAGIGASGLTYLLGEAGLEHVLPASLMKKLQELLAALAKAKPSKSTLGSVVVGSPLSALLRAAAPAAAAKPAATTAAVAATAASTAAVTTAAATTAASTAKATASKVAAANKAAATAAKTNATELAKVQAANAVRLKTAQATNAEELAKVTASNATRAQKAAAENAAQAAATAAANAARLAKAAKSNDTIQARAAALNAQHLADQAAANAARAAKAAGINAKELAEVEAGNATRLAKAKATDAANLAKQEQENAARLAKEVAQYGTAASIQAAAAATATATATAAATKKALARSTAGSVIIRAPELGPGGLAAAVKAAPVTKAAVTASAKSAAALHAAHVAHVAHDAHLYALAHPAPAPSAAVHATYTSALHEVTSRTAATPMTEHELQEQQLAQRMAKYGTVTINVYPQKGQSEAAIAASVSSHIMWSVQGGAR